VKYAKLDQKGLPLAFYSEDIHGPLQVPVYGEAPAALAEPNPVRPVTGQARNPAIPAGVVPLTDEQWMEFLANPEARRWNGSRVVPYP
jgi:hypothetical protein